MNALPLILLLLAASVLAVSLFRRAGLPPVLGYLAVGALIGPHAFNFLKNVTGAESLAEFGVVFLMFSIGLEFSLPRLYAMKRLVFGLGLVQVLGSMAVVGGVAMLAGVSWQGAIALGGVLAMSSTAVLSKLLTERMQLDSPHGREVMGVLLFQDLAVVPLLILIPAFSRPPNEMLGMLGLALIKAATVLAVVLFIGQKLMRPWFTLVARRKTPELFILNVLLITLGLSWITGLAGLSQALGAFVAGMLISETEFRHQVEEDIKPFRDVLMGLFFVTVGMLLDVHILLDYWFWIAGVLFLLLALKFVVAAGASRLFGAFPGTALRSGLWLCAGGEFGFVLLSDIGDNHLASKEILQITLAALVLSMLLAPVIVHFSERIVMRFVASEWLQRSMQLTRIAAQSLAAEKHAIICGFGRNGQYLARFLAQEEVSYVALDLDPDRVREAAAGGESVVFGDCSRRETLMAAGLQRASVVVVTFADLRGAERILHHVRELRPELPVVVRSADERNMDRLIKAGAAEVVPEALEASLMLSSHALVLVGVPLTRVLRRLRHIRAQRYNLMRGFYRGLSDREEDESEGVRFHSLYLAKGAFAVGRRIEELGLADLGVEVSALRRREIRADAPVPETRLEAEDVLVLLGPPEGLEVAKRKLLKGK